MVGPFHLAFTDFQTDSHLSESSVRVEFLPEIAGTAHCVLHPRHIGMIYPIAPLALDAVLHIIGKIAEIFDIQGKLFLRRIESLRIFFIDY